MTWVTAAVVMGGAQVASGLIGANAAGKAADKQAQAALEAAQIQKQMFDIQNKQQAPYREAGYSALKDISGMKPYLTQKYGPEDFMQGIDPGYAFRLQQGQMANQRAANVGGGALSGNTLAGLQAYTQGQASQEYGNAFNRFQTERKNIYNTLASIAGLGQTANSESAQAAQSYGANTANLMGNAAAAQAAGTMGTANAFSGGIQGAGNAYTFSQMMRNNPAMGQTFNQNTGWSGGGTGMVNVPGEGSMSIGQYFTPA